MREEFSRIEFNLHKILNPLNLKQTKWEIAKNLEFLNDIDGDFFIKFYNNFLKNQNKKINLLSKDIKANLDTSFDPISLYLTKHIFKMYASLPENKFELESDERWLPANKLINDTWNETKKFIIFYEISHKKYPTKEETFFDIKKLIFKSVEDMTSSKLITENVVRDSEGKTQKLKNIKIHSSTNFLNNNIYLTPSTLIRWDNKIYSVNTYYSYTHEIYKKNKLNINDELYESNNLGFLKNILHRRLFFDVQLGDIVIKLIENITGASESQISSGEHKKQKKIELSKHRKITNFSENAKYMSDKSFMYKKIQKDLSHLIGFAEFIHFWNNWHYYMEGFFISFFLDFRWRIYSMGMFSPTNSKLFRLCLDYGVYSSQELEIIEKEISQTKSWKIIEEKKILLCELLKIKLTKFKNYEIAGLFWSLIEIGKFFKSSLTKDGKVELNNFLIKGAEIYYTSHNLTDPEDILSIQKAIWCIQEILDKSLYTKRIYFKDATASVLQHLLKILGKKNNDSIKYCNFTDNYNWWDPYHIIIENYLSKNHDCKIKQFMKRRYFKKMIMTFNYSATMFKNMEDTLSEIRKSDIFNALDETEKHLLIKNAIEEIKNFRKYLENSYEEEIFFMNKSSSIIDEWSADKDHITTFDKQKIKVNYYKTKEKRINTFTTDKSRKTHVYYELTKEYDKIATEKALRANIIHSSDSQFSRLMLFKYPIISIHDSFGVDIFNICKFIDDANKAMNMRLIETRFKYVDDISPTDAFYSIFILL